MSREERPPMTTPRMPRCATCEQGEQCSDCVDACDVSRSHSQRDALSAYEERDVLQMSRTAAHVEATGYKRWDRARETIEFAHRMGYERLGLAFCAYLSHEAAAYNRRLESEGFTVVSVMCKAGGVPKETILGLGDEAKVCPGTPESMCNPIAQARLLADAGVELNIVMGLCVGHDALFIRHAVGPVTVLVAKDRVQDHKPVDGIREGSPARETAEL
jgi:uncharacterized metal-binding protein